MIEVKNLTKHYGEFAAVRDVSFDVQKGEILGFLGPNAAGKTTTMRIITGFLSPTSGTATVNGHDVFYEGDEVKKAIGYLPERPPLYPEMRVADYLSFVAEIKGVPSRDRRGAVGTAMQKTQTDHVSRQVIGTLSKGYQQRVGIAQALVHNPPILILDEPTSGLDPKQIVEARGLIKSLQGDHTVILSTHILPEVAQTCDRVVIINKGKIVAIDRVANLGKLRSGHERLEVKFPEPIDAKKVQEAIESVDGVQGVVKPDPAYSHPEHDTLVLNVMVKEARAVTPLIVRKTVEAGFPLLGIRRIEQSLEEIFLKFVSEDTANEKGAAA